MGILLGFAPFIVFALLTSVSVSLGIWLAFAAAFVITIRDFVESPTLRLLDAGSVALFGLLALYTGFIEPSLSLPLVRLAVAAGFLLLALVSILILQPITLPYSHEHVPEALWNTKSFRRANYVLTAAWALAFAVTGAFDIAAALYREISVSLDISAGLAALGLVIAFTVRYPAAVSRANGHAVHGGQGASSR